MTSAAQAGANEFSDLRSKWSWYTLYLYSVYLHVACLLLHITIIDTPCGVSIACGVSIIVYYACGVSITACGVSIIVY